VDFNNELPQPVFIHYGEKSISPLLSYQQISRTRNISEVFIYAKEKRSKYIRNNTMESIERDFNKIIQNLEAIKSMFLRLEAGDVEQK
jgi:hypothetical protein